MNLSTSEVENTIRENRMQYKTHIVSCDQCSEVMSKHSISIIILLVIIEYTLWIYFYWFLNSL